MVSSSLRHLVFIVVVGVVVLGSNLGGPRLWDRDEPRNAGCTREMLARGDWITPVFDGELRTHKPILLYWFMMTAYSLFGVNEFAARFWSAASAIGTALVTYGIGRRLFSPTVGVWAAVILVTTLMFDVAARAATPDALLIFWSTAALGCFVWGMPDLAVSGPGSAVAAEMDRRFPRWPMAVLLYACMGMAVLAKGPVGFVLPTAVIGMYQLFHRMPAVQPSMAGHVGVARWVRMFSPRHVLGCCWSLRPVTALLVVLAVALPWYAAVAWRTDGAWVKGFILEHNVGRATRPLEGHHGSLLYYPLALLVGFFPWSVFAVPTALDVAHRLRSRDRTRAASVLMLCWLGVYIGLFSLAQTKLPSYITPSYPAAALLVANFLVAWCAHATPVARRWPQAAFACLGIVGTAILVAVPVATARFLPGESWLAGLGAIPALTAATGLLLIRRDARTHAASAFAAGALLFTTGLFAFGAARVDTHQTFDTLIRAVHQRSADPQIGTLGVAEPSWVFYAGRPLDRLVVAASSRDTPGDPSAAQSARRHAWTPKPTYDVWQYLSQSADRYAITSQRYLDSVGGLRGDVQVLARTPYFLQNDMLLLLARRDAGQGLATRRPADHGRR